MHLEALEDRVTPSIVLPPGFEETRVGGPFGWATVMEFAPDGRIFVGERNGVVSIVKDGAILPTPVLTVPADYTESRGLLGMTLDPHFDHNGYIYVYYTSLQPAHEDRITRFTISPGQDVADPASEVVILDGIPSGAGWHDGGAMHFGKDGMLYVATGDGHDPVNAPSLQTLNGKALRLNTASYPNVVPPDNPFVSTPNARAEIWAVGFRNPYTSAVDPVTGLFYVNDVGQDHWEEVNNVVKGANYGWPTAEGISSLPGLTNPVHAYHHDGLSSAITGGVFYRATQFPAAYRNQYYFGDYLRGFIRRMDLTTHEVTDFLTSEPWLDGMDPSTVPGVADLDVGPDGSLYYLSLFRGSIYKIEYVGITNRAPDAVAKANTTSGLSPLHVTFDAAGSSDPDGDALTYVWDFGDQSPTATGLSVSHTYTKPGHFEARLTVSDGQGASTPASPIQITVGNRAPTGTILTPLASLTYSAGDTITFSGSGMDPEDGALPASAMTWFVLLRHDTHTHPMLGPLIGTTDGSIKIPQTGELSDDVSIRIRLIVTDSGGLQHESVREVFPHKATLTLTTDPVGLPLALDGQTRPTPADIRGVVGMNRTLGAPLQQVVNGVTYQFVGWSTGSTSAQQSIEFPATDTIYTARYQPVDPEYTLLAVAAADVSSGLAPLQVTFTAAGSSGPPGIALNYSWDPGDGSPTQAGSTATHTYALSGEYQAQLTVSDMSGNLARSTPIKITVHSPTPPSNQPPHAVAAADQNSGAAPLQVSFTGSGSHDPDEDPLSYSWDFGDESPLVSGQDVTYTYVQPGQYKVLLTVSDGRGGVAQAAAIQITVGPPPNQPPLAVAVADRLSGAAPLQVAFSATGSSDPDGDPLDYRWSFGDEAPVVSGASVTHTYSQPGQYEARLTVSDGRGGVAVAAVLPIKVSESSLPPSQPDTQATADVTSGAAPLQVTFRVVSSEEPGTDTKSYTWNFGDESPLQSGRTATHTYTQPGQFQALLTVHDAQGGSQRSYPVAITVHETLPGDNIADCSFPEAFVRAVYADLLGRVPDAEGLTYWLGQLTSGASTAQVVAGIWHSAEHRAVQVHGYYTTLLGRPSAEAERAAWIVLFQGGAGETDVMQAFLSSEEYSLLYPDDGVFVDALYTQTLQRDADAEGHAFWIQALQQGSRAQVVQDFLGTAERTFQIIEDTYGRFLHRATDAADRGYWSTLLQTSPVSVADVSATVLASHEYWVQAFRACSGLSSWDFLVQAAYNDLLKRTADALALSFWGAQLEARIPTEQVIRSLWESGEHRGLQVESYYVSFLDRSATDGERAAWVALFEAGAGEADVMEAVLSSTEHGLLYPDDGSFVDALYTQVLEREADAEGRAYWAQVLQQGRSRAEVVHDFLRTSEAHIQVIDRYYTDFFHRGADAAERAYWLSQLQSGALAQPDLVRRLLASEEYFLHARDRLL